MPENNREALEQAMGEQVTRGLSRRSKDQAMAFNPMWIILVGQIVLKLLELWRSQNPKCENRKLRTNWRRRDKFRREMIQELNNTELAGMSEEIAHTISHAYSNRNRLDYDRILDAYWTEDDDKRDQLVMAALSEVSPEERLEVSVEAKVEEKKVEDGGGNVPVFRKGNPKNNPGVVGPPLRKPGETGESRE